MLNINTIFNALNSKFDFKGIKTFNPVHCHIINFSIQKLAAIQNHFLGDSKTIEPFNRHNIQKVF